MNREQRRLAAILAADVVGYSRLMGRDEAGTLARLREHRKQRFEPTLARYGGRLVKLAGDGVLAEFPSAVAAVSAAIEFQQSMRESNAGQPDDTAIVFRIGIHIGDLIVDGDDLYGDGVNVAARLEAEAPAGGIVISGAVLELVEGRLAASFEDMGQLALKNIERPMRALRTTWEASDWGPASVAFADGTKTEAAPDAAASASGPATKPSIAVLAFTNMSGDREQEHFSDGIAEDLITALALFRQFDVIARNSSFTYKGAAVDIKQVGRDLGVRYVLEGSVRKVGNRVRVTAQLIDAATGSHAWADRYDGELADVFGLQDEITGRIAAAITPAFQLAELKRINRKHPQSLDAWELALRARQCFARSRPEDFDEAEMLVKRALVHDPRHVPALSLLATLHAARAWLGFAGSPQRSIAESFAAARRALMEDASDAEAMACLGSSLHAAGKLDEAYDVMRQAVGLNPNSAIAHGMLGVVLAFRGEYESCVTAMERAIRLSPRDPYLGAWYSTLSTAAFVSGRFREGVGHARRAVLAMPDFVACYRNLAANLSALGEIGEARQAVAEALRLMPHLDVATTRLLPFADPAASRRYGDALALAGLPEGSPHMEVPRT